MCASTFPGPQVLTSVDSDGKGKNAIHARHVVQFYVDDVFLADELGDYVGSALTAGDGAIVIATQAHREAIGQRLLTRGIDPLDPISQGRYIALDAAETLSKFMVDGFPDATLFIETIGSMIVQATACAEGENPHVAAFGEMVALLWAEGKTEAALRLEELWNTLASVHNFTLRCAYPLHGFNREEHQESFLRICAIHGGVIPGENYTTLSTDNDRFRTIAVLQQRAQALSSEIVERKRVEEELRRSKAELETLVEQRTLALRRLSARLLTLQDVERRRLARELHDCLGQALIGLKLNIDLLRRTPEREQLWGDVEGMMHDCIGEVRTLSYLLHPPTMDAAGLASAARWFVEGFGQRSGISVKLEVERTVPRLQDEFEMMLFRVLQEALTNVHRHSGSTAAEVSIRQDGDQVILEVVDHGSGIKPDVLARPQSSNTGGGIGLTGMRERVHDLGGILEIDSNPGGTSVRVTIPVTSGVPAGKHGS
jgi:signal transduction histidine kinase